MNEADAIAAWNCRPTWSDVERVFKLGEQIALELMAERALADDLAAALRRIGTLGVVPKTEPWDDYDAVLARYREARQ